MENESLEQVNPLEPTGNIVSMTESNNELTIGLLLRQARESKNLSIDAISRHTKINVTNLMALESNDVENLPNIAYVKGFVKSYAKIVGIDTQHALDTLDQLYHIPHDNEGDTIGEAGTDTDEPQVSQRVTNPEAVATPSASKKSMPNDLKIKIFGAVAACAIAGFIFINKDEKKLSAGQEQIVVKPQVLTAQTPLTKTQAQEAKVEGDITETQSPQAKELAPVSAPQPKIVEKKQEPVKKEEKVEAKPEIKKEETKADKKEETKKVEFYAMPSPLFKINSMSEDKVKELIPSNYFNAVEIGRQNVFIHAVSGNTWLTYKVDNEPVKKYILKKDRYALFKGEDVRILLGNVHVTKVFLNNQLLDITSRSGVKSLVFPIEKSKELKLPLFIFNKDGSVITSQKYLEQNPQ